MRRREFLLAAAGSLLSSAAVPKSELSVEGYIFMQYAQSLKKPLAEVIPEVLPMAKAAGFNNIELNQAFFQPEIRDSTLALIKAQGLSMPSVYVGGLLHEKQSADQTIARALDIGRLCAPFGCKGIVNNPDPKPQDQPKTDAELAVEADSLNRMGRALSDAGFALRVHHHTPQLENNAREWRYISAQYRSSIRTHLRRRGLGLSRRLRAACFHRRGRRPVCRNFTCAARRTNSGSKTWRTATSITTRLPAI